MSVPKAPSILFVPELPIRVLSRLLPVASISEEPVKVIFSTLLGRVKETEVSTKSVPSFRFSPTLSAIDSTT